jgi:uncharacterized membrane protein HdeD (DUF308 family)
MHLLSRTKAEASRASWWTLLLVGACAIVFGVVAIVWPHLTFFVFLYIFGVYAIIEGLILIAHAFYAHQAPKIGDYSDPTMPPGGWLIVLGFGILSVLAGLFCLFVPGRSARVSLYVVATWALFAGISALAQTLRRGWLVGLAGVAAIAVSILLFVHTAATAQAVLWLVGILALIAGVLLLIQSWLKRPVTMTETPDFPSM